MEEDEYRAIHKIVPEWMVDIKKALVETTKPIIESGPLTANEVQELLDYTVTAAFICLSNYVDDTICRKGLLSSRLKKSLLCRVEQS